MILKLIEHLKSLPGITEGSTLYADCVNEGMTPLKINFYFELDAYYKVRLIINKRHNDSKERSYTETAEAFKCCDMTVKRAVSSMKPKEI